jgi:RNA polymerase sigma factor (sigma-70 family)
VEASTLQATASLGQPRVSITAPLLRFRSDEQLVALFRAGHDEAFRAIHDRYHKRLFAYARQMLPARQDAEDALQDVFVRAYSGLRANDRDLALRAWLFRVAHNRCIDELRRPAPPPPEVLQLVRSTVQDPIAEVDRRESLRRLIADVRRLPEQQRSALLLRELGGMSYSELATALGISIGAVKSVLVRARIALAQAAEARDTACAEIREEIVTAHDRGVRPNATARRHMRDCPGCRGFRRELRGVTRQFAALSPAVGPLGFLTKVLGLSTGAGGSATAGSATAGGAAVVGGTGVIAGGGAAVGAGHVATLIAAAVATAGGAVEIQHTITARPHPPARVHLAAKHAQRPPATGPLTSSAAPSAPAQSFPSTAAVVQSAASAVLKTHPSTAALNKAIKRDLRKPSSSSATGGGAALDPVVSTDPATTSSTDPATCIPTDPSLTDESAATSTSSCSPSSSGGSSGSTTTGPGSNGTSDTSSTGGGSASSVSGGPTNTSGSGTSSSTIGSGTSGAGTSSSTSGTSSGSSSGTSSSGTSAPSK